MKSGTILSVAFATTACAQQSVWGQCGGTGWTGATTCVAGTSCSRQNDWYYQCLPATFANTHQPNSAKTSSIPAAASSSNVDPTTTIQTHIPTASGKTLFAGVNVAGFDFGCQINGTCDLSQTDGPLASLGHTDGAAQMQHFVHDDNMNIFRLPVAWQFLQPSLGGSLNKTALGQYDDLMKACLATGAHCILDIHNYARFNGEIIGQGGPSNVEFAQLWSHLATKYASFSKVVFGIMNEPHDLPSITSWAASVQAAVNAIRNAGATSQIILLPGNNFTSAANFILNGSGAALMSVTNPNGSTSGLIFDVHQYLDSDFSGTHPDCVTNNEDTFQDLAAWLRSNNRQALLSETGGGNVHSCMTRLCQQIACLNANSDVYLGYIGWAAGSFSSPNYALAETPNQNGGIWTDLTIVKACLAR